MQNRIKRSYSHLMFISPPVDLFTPQGNWKQKSKKKKVSHTVNGHTCTQKIMHS